MGFGHTNKETQLGDAKCLKENLWSLTSVLSGCHAPGLTNTGVTFQPGGFLSSKVFADDIPKPVKS